MNNIKLYQKLGQVVQYSRSELVTFYFDFYKEDVGVLQQHSIDLDAE